MYHSSKLCRNPHHVSRRIEHVVHVHVSANLWAPRNQSICKDKHTQTTNYHMPPRLRPPSKNTVAWFWVHKCVKSIHVHVTLYTTFQWKIEATKSVTSQWVSTTLQHHSAGTVNLQHFCHHLTRQIWITFAFMYSYMHACIVTHVLILNSLLDLACLVLCLSEYMKWTITTSYCQLFSPLLDSAVHA